MDGTVLVDSGFLASLLRLTDTHQAWAIAQAAQHPRPWQTCEAVLSEAFFLLGPPGRPALLDLLRRRSVIVAFGVASDPDPILQLMDKYGNVPMSFADACLVRMSEVLPRPVLLTTDTDFRVYRRHGRQVVPCVLPE